MKTCTAFPMILAVALTAALALAPAVGSASPPRPAAIYVSMFDQGEGQMFSLSGVVQSVDYASNVIVVRVRGDIETVRITPTTSIERNGEIGGIADIRPGLHVRVKGSIRDGELTAESIVVRK